MTSRDCPFCHLPADRVWLQTDHAIAFRDAYPVAEGHSLVIARAHHASVFDATAEEQAALWRMVSEVREQLDAELHPDGFTIGVNDGAAAGQTVMHGHIHVIPRRSGDVADPRGGVRHVLPKMAKYWEEP